VNRLHSFALIPLPTVSRPVLTLLEFRVRRALAAEGITLTGVYAGQKGRQTMRPSTELLLEAFQGIDAIDWRFNLATVFGEKEVFGDNIQTGKPQPAPRRRHSS
jgi:hypothetical protein